MGDLESQCRGLEYGGEMRESLHRVYRYLYPWLPIDMIQIDYARKMKQESERLCSVHICNWWIGGFNAVCCMKLGDDYSM